MGSPEKPKSLHKTPHFFAQKTTQICYQRPHPQTPEKKSLFQQKRPFLYHKYTQTLPKEPQFFTEKTPSKNYIRKPPPKFTKNPPFSFTETPPIA